MKARIQRFTVVFEGAEEGGYIARVPSLPGCVSQGETLDEAERMISDAIRAYCASLRKHRQPVPRDMREVIETIEVAVPA
jgi:predicted RNase H-like HicB family nuclease